MAKKEEKITIEDILVSYKIGKITLPEAIYLLSKSMFISNETKSQ